MTQSQVEKNKFGFYELIKKPPFDELAAFYKNEYFQSQNEKMNEEENLHIENKLLQRYSIIENFVKLISVKGKFLDVGCGEGRALKFFKKKGWDVLGLDYSEYGCRSKNPDCLPYLKIGDIYTLLSELSQNSSNFHCILLDNVLEHVLNPQELLNLCYKVLDDTGLLVIEVPNDFSILQEFLLNEKCIDHPFWIRIPDHISYFNLDGLKALGNHCGFNCVDSIADYPIDLNLVNPLTNYVKNPEVGKSCHYSRVKIENFLFSISMEKTNELYRQLLSMGLGRNMSVFFKKQ